MNDVAPNLFDRALRRLTSAWREVAGNGGSETEPSLQVRMEDCLRARGGEVSARNRAAGLAQAYLAADDPGRREFLLTLAGFDADPEAVATACETLSQAVDETSRAAAHAALRRALEPPRLKLLTQFTSIPEGPKFLVDLRAVLLRMRGDAPPLAALESDLRGLLGAWFDIGFLELRRIDWDSPAALLEKLIDYEAVHAIRGWSDLKNRLDSDRRCYAFFHPRMPGEPLIFVEVALVHGLAGSVQHLLDEDAPVLDPHKADTAIFYSISNCQAGLAGISFGNFLIKRVVEELSHEFRNLRAFATLSPIPGFRRWLDPQLAASAAGLLTAEEETALLDVLPSEESGPRALATLLARPDWWVDPAMRKAGEAVLTRLCARYLLAEGTGKRARDPVAHFHLSNGAKVERVNLGADVSAKGVTESATLMVNYLYDLARIEAYHEDYAGDGRRNAAPVLRKLAKVPGQAVAVVG